MKKTITFIFIIYSFFSFGQIDANSLFSVPRATTAELNAITAPAPQLGSLAFDTDKDRLVEYTSTGWQEILTDSNVYVGSFIIDAPGGTTATSYEEIVVGLPFEPSQITFVAHANIEAFGVDGISSAGTNTATLQNSFGTGNGFAREDSGSIVQSTIYVGGSGSSINSISRYSSNSQCIGLRYGNQDGVDMGKITGVLDSFNSPGGFTITFSYSLGVSGNADRDNDILDESVVVLYTAYK